MIDFMREANNLANINLETNDGGPFGAVVVKNGNIIGRGRNQVIKMHDPSAHAEVMAIRDACNNLGTHDLSDCVIYTSCYPCPMCLGAIVWSNIKEVYYGNTKFDAEDIGFRDNMIYEYLNGSNKDLIKLEQIGRDVTIDAFNKYKEAKEKAIY